MTENAGKRMLPLNPHPDYLRKEAKTRLAELKKRVPSARLADVHFTIAREHGFANWGALLDEVVRRTGGPRSFWTHIRRWPVAALYPDYCRRGWEQEPDSEFHAAFFRTGIVTQTGFIFTALIGVSLLFLTQQQIHVLHSALGQAVRLTHAIL